MSKDYRREKHDLEEDEDNKSGNHRKGSVHEKHSDDLSRRKRDSKNLSREREGKLPDNE